MVCAVQPNSRDSSAGVLPARANSTICYRNSAGYGGLDLGIVNSFHSKNEVSTEAGQLQLQGAAALAHGVSLPTIRKWLGRYLAQGEGALAIVELRRRRLTQARIAASLGVSKSTVGRVLARAGLSRLKDLEPIVPVVRYEHEAAGDLLHVDTKRLGRIVRPGHRVTGDRSGPFGKAGWEFLFVAIDSF
jgi:hypothetical protein